MSPEDDARLNAIARRFLDQALDSHITALDEGFVVLDEAMWVDEEDLAALNRAKAERR